MNEVRYRVTADLVVRTDQKGGQLVAETVVTRQIRQRLQNGELVVPILAPLGRIEVKDIDFGVVEVEEVADDVPLVVVRDDAALQGVAA